MESLSNKRMACTAGLLLSILLPGLLFAAGTPPQSFLAIARILNAAAVKEAPDARAFAYYIEFRTMLNPSDTHFAVFDFDGDFAYPADNLRYYIYHWRDGRVELSGRSVQFFLPAESDCWGGTRPAFPFTPPPQLEQPKDHPPLRGWSIDFPQLRDALMTNADLFVAGAKTLTITSARRLRLDLRPVCGGSICSIRPNCEALNLVDDGRPVMKVDDEAGHYLILDAGSGATIERGAYELPIEEDQRALYGGMAICGARTGRR